ncbi:DJ-1/PfpI family protein [Utexia brackfieldae]|uniref:DJ-1/PfpI family protein n=1 Tax=Utexia brackfieldae TaxID=3074108 RepID=UPI00370D3497
MYRFSDNKLHGNIDKFELIVCSAERGDITTNAGFSLKGIHNLSVFEQADMIIIPGWRDPNESPTKRLITALRKAHQKGTKIVGLCLDSFVLAAADLLEGRTATTHWCWIDEFTVRYPNIIVQPDFYMLMKEIY